MTLKERENNLSLRILKPAKSRHGGKIRVDGREYIFRNDPNKLDNMRNILNEIESIIADLKTVQIYG